MMNWDSFVERLQQAQDTQQANVGLLLNPTFSRLPLPITRHDDPLFPFSKAIVDATRDLVCVYIFDLAAYMALGAAGVVALERSIRYAGSDSLTLLHAPFTGTGYSAMADATGFGVDAITVTRPEDVTHYLEKPPYAAFLMDYGGDDPDVPARGGVYCVGQEQLHLRNSVGDLLTTKVTDKDLLSVGKLDDYAERIREAVEAFA